MKTKYPVIYEGHPNQPVEGDMLVWDGSEWVRLKTSYELLTVYSNTADWDCFTGFKKKIANNGNVILTITNIAQGIGGDLLLDTRTEGMVMALRYTQTLIHGRVLVRLEDVHIIMTYH